MRHAGSQFPNQGSNLCPLQQKRGFLTTGLPGKSLLNVNLKTKQNMLFSSRKFCYNRISSSHRIWVELPSVSFRSSISSRAAYSESSASSFSLWLPSLFKCTVIFLLPTHDCFYPLAMGQAQRYLQALPVGGVISLYFCIRATFQAAKKSGSLWSS